MEPTLPKPFRIPHGTEAKASVQETSIWGPPFEHNLKDHPPDGEVVARLSPMGRCWFSCSESLQFPREPHSTVALLWEGANDKSSLVLIISGGKLRLSDLRSSLQRRCTVCSKLSGLQPGAQQTLACPYPTAVPPSHVLLGTVQPLLTLSVVYVGSGETSQRPQEGLSTLGSWSSEGTGLCSFVGWGG